MIFYKSYWQFSLKGDFDFFANDAFIGDPLLGYLFLLHVQDQIARDIAEALKVKLVPEAKGATNK
jgi:hypothetical protein